MAKLQSAPNFTRKTTKTYRKGTALYMNDADRNVLKTIMYYSGNRLLD